MPTEQACYHKVAGGVVTFGATPPARIEARRQKEPPSLIVTHHLLR